MNELSRLMDLQGEIKILLISKFGMDQTLAHEIAAELLDCIAKHSVVKEDVRKAYQEL